MDKVILLRPLISEKSMGLKDSHMYTFVVSRDATKSQVEKVISSKFNVDVLDVKLINLPAKIRRQRKVRGTFATKALRKALVKIKNNQTIALFESAIPEKEVEVVTAEGEHITNVKEKKSLLSGTKVKIEKEPKIASVSKAQIAEENENKRPTKVSQKEAKKGAKA